MTDAKGIAKFRRPREFNPDYAEVYYSLGIAYHKDKKYDEAIDAYKKSLEIRPNSAVAYYGLGISCLRKGYMSAGISYLYKAVLRYL